VISKPDILLHNKNVPYQRVTTSFGAFALEGEPYHALRVAVPPSDGIFHVFSIAPTPPVVCADSPSHVAMMRSSSSSCGRGVYFVTLGTAVLLLPSDRRKLPVWSVLHVYSSLDVLLCVSCLVSMHRWG
jgi:hypothetical protein